MSDFKDFKTGDLLVFKKPPTGFLPRLYSNIIRFTTHSIFTHVAIVVKEEDDIYLIEAVLPKVRKVKLSIYKEDFFHISLNIEDKITHKDILWLHDRIGEDYSLLQAFLSLFKYSIKDSNWICTELSKDFYNRLNLDIKFDDSHLEPGEFSIKMLELEGSTQRLIKVRK